MLTGSVSFVAGCTGNLSPSESTDETSTFSTEAKTPVETTPQPTRVTTAIQSTTTTEWRRYGHPITPTPPRTTTLTTSDRVSPKSYPELPERLNRESVVEFVKATERAFKINEIIQTEESRHSTLMYVDIS
ncbi:hypothetical protein [Haladaptatus sp. DFWS20]|uniref:hypothetical protein n=1 Tax=Haladaptatus sp. DFWS20 TaxID=3403467 RepID=UPI003EB85178